MTNPHSYQRSTDIQPTWCPGCGNFAILAAINQALDQLQLAPHQLTMVYDVGCSGNMADFVSSYGFHGLHGRALPVAAGIKLANHRLPVIAVIGDGGCFGEGLNHFISLARGNHDILVITHDNYLYSLTTGQVSPISQQGTITPSTPYGSIDQPFNQLGTAILNHATFVARGFSGHIPSLAQLLKKGIDHTGFAVVDILQPCTTYNRHMTYQWYKKRIYPLTSKNHHPGDKQAALALSQQTDRLATGIFYQKQAPAFHQQLPNFPSTPLNQADISKINISQFL